MLTTTIIIPTINRINDLEVTLRSVVSQTIQPNEVVVIDQCDNQSALSVVRKFETELDIKHIYTTTKSLTNARNLGVLNSSGDIVCMLDDDVYLDSGYVKGIVSFFESSPNALGVQGIITNFSDGYLKKVGGQKIKFYAYQLFATFFFLNRAGKKKQVFAFR